MSGIILRYLAATLLLGLLIAAICGSGTPEAQQGTSQSGEMACIVGVDGQFQPFSYLDSSGNIQGFDVDSMRWIAEKEGLSVTFQVIEWDGIIPALLADKIDIIYSGMTITPERSEKVDFSVPYWEVNQDVVARSDSATTLDDVCAGKVTIGSKSGCTATTWIDQNLVQTGKMPSSQLKLYANTPLAIDDLVAGRTDAVIFDDLVLKDMIANRPVKIIGNIETHEEFGIAVRKSDSQLLATLNDGLAQLKADPYWQELIVKYSMK
jgi:polar amino acid transport system substrate-binding protein